MHRRGSQRGRLAKRGADARLQRAPLDPCSGSAEPDARPAQGRVDVVRERDLQAIVGHPETAAEALERGVERIETRPLRTEASVLVPQAVALLDASEMEEPGRDLVVRRQLAALDLFPGGRVVGDVVSEAELCRADRVEHPAGAALDACRNHVTALRTTRARWTRPGFGSSTAKTAST